MPPINPTFNIGPLVIHWYGIMIVLGALAGAYAATFEAKRRGEDPEHVWNALTWCLIAGILGARLYHVLSSPQGVDIGFQTTSSSTPLHIPQPPVHHPLARHQRAGVGAGTGYRPLGQLHGSGAIRPTDHAPTGYSD